AVDLGVANDRLRVAALGDGLDVLEEAVADHGDAAVAAREMLLAAVGDDALPDPGGEVLIHHAAGQPFAGLLVGHRPDPVGDRVLNVGLAVLGHAVEEPADAQRRLVIDRHAPFEMPAGQEAIGPEANPADAPQRIVLVGVLADALVDETVIEFV